MECEVVWSAMNWYRDFEGDSYYRMHWLLVDFNVVEMWFNYAMQEESL